MHEIVPVAFWVPFTVGSMVITACLIGVFSKNLQLTDARWHLDDGAEEGPGREIYELYLASGRLAAWAGVLAGALVLLTFACAVGGTWAKITTLAVSTVLGLAADHLRTRHGRLESRFRRTVGESLVDFCRRVSKDAVRA